MSVTWGNPDLFDPCNPFDILTVHEIPDLRSSAQRCPTLVERVCAVVDAALSHRGLIAVQSH